jgi:hypothetical protein
VIPPFRKEPPAASGAWKAYGQIPCNNKENHPRNRNHKSWSERSEQTHRNQGNSEADWYIAEEGEPRQISSPSVLMPRVSSRHFKESLAQALLIVL